MVNTLAKDVVGYTAPKLQVLTDNAEFNLFVEQEWRKWSRDKTVNLTAKLKLLDATKRIEGEGFQFLKTDEETKLRTNYSLNIEVIGSSRITDPRAYEGLIDNKANSYNDDGVIVNRSTGRPIFYHIMPASYNANAFSLIESNGMIVNSKYVQQWFSPTRTGQYRGVCEIQAALTLFANIRRYSLATLLAAEIAANFAGVMKTTAPAGESPPVVKEYSEVPLVRGMLISLPDGWEAQQFEPKQPVANYDIFVNTQLREVGRLLDVPRGVMIGDSSAYNYSSARLDYQNYDDRVGYEREQIVIICLDPTFDEWFAEFMLVNRDNIFVQAYRLLNNGEIISPKHSWQFTKRPSIDPQKDAEASKQRMKNLTSNLAMECALNGDDWEEVLDQWKKIIEKINKLGLTNTILSDIMVSGDGSVPTVDSTNVNPTVDTQPTDIQTVKPTVDVQATALNGAQIASFLLVTDKLQGKLYPPEAAKGIIRAAFPGITDDLINTIVQAISSYTPPSIPQTGLNGKPNNVGV
jgi:capsid protein